MHPPPDAVVLAVGAGNHGAALRFAVDESRRSSRPLHVVHVLETPTGVDATHAPRRMVRAARLVLEEAGAAASALAGPTVPVSTELLCDGSVVDQLADGVTGASVLVLQHRTLGRARRTVSRSMVLSVAGRVPVPVAQVPAGWNAVESTRTVTIAVQDPVVEGELLRCGFERSVALGARVVILHAWWLTTGFEGIDVGPGVRLPWEARTRIELEDIVRSWRDGTDQVPVRIDLRYAPPVEAVLDAAAESDLLVMGRRSHQLPPGSHLGPVASAALMHAVCPVWFVPESDEAAVPALQSVPEHHARTQGRS